MRLSAVELHSFRGYGRCRISFGEGLHVIHGPNAAGKTNLLEALYLGCTARSCRTAHEREAIAFGARQASVRLIVDGESGRRVIAVVLSRGEGRRVTIDGTPVSSLLSCAERPLASVFLPDRLALIKGAPALRRAHLDQLVCALWPARVQTRRAYAGALAQRNALLARVRAGLTDRQSIASWDLRLAQAAVALRDDRRAAVERLRPAFARVSGRLGLEGELELRYRAASAAASAAALAEELAQRLEADLRHGYTLQGPHRDELAVRRDGRELRVYGSQGEQRLALLALLLAEREAIAEQRGIAPVILLDDVMSELDPSRREALVELLGACGGQAFIATADLGQVPLARASAATRIAVRSGAALSEAQAA